jgi:hypothetical protein|tara:strand:- start:1660 stop:1947 length:288 start_codon:yes stop_codon:yes gene_type:complete
MENNMSNEIEDVELQDLDVIVDLEETEETKSFIDVNDLVDCVKVIDLCSKRGAFEGTELQLVGTLRQKLVDFVNAVSPPETDDGADSTEADEPSE